ncbi:MAG: hypothetical protein ACRDLB_10860 [Actinomycetota bacterium]
MDDDPSRAARYSDLFAEQHEHGLSSEACAYCPICATIAVVRNTKPEVLEHLAAAARELIVAAGILLDEAGEVIGEQAKKTDPERDGKVTRIDIG